MEQDNDAEEKQNVKDFNCSVPVEQLGSNDV